MTRRRIITWQSRKNYGTGCSSTATTVVVSKDALIKDLKKALSERNLKTELDEHEADAPPKGRNGHLKQTALTSTSKMQLSIPRNRTGTFDPKLIAKYRRRFPKFDDEVVSMYARGMSVREIRGHLEELYGIDVAPDLISAVTDALRMRWPNGRIGHTPPIRWCWSMRSGSTSGTRAS